MTRPDSTAPPVPALFLHIRKTAGTSIVQMAMDHYGYENICSHGDYMGNPPSHLENLLFISGHFGFDFARELLPGRFSFTFLRNPIERIISLYCFCRTRDPEEFPIYRAAASNDLEGFLNAAADDDLVHSYLSNSQVWCLASGPGITEIADRLVPPEDLFDRAVENAGLLSYIGFFETFEKDATVILNALNMTGMPMIRHDNVTPDKIPVSSLPPRTVERLRALTQWDRKLYDVLYQKYRGELT